MNQRINKFFDNLEYFVLLIVLFTSIIIFLTNPKFTYTLILIILFIFSVLAILILYKIIKID